MIRSLFARLFGRRKPDPGDEEAFERDSAADDVERGDGGEDPADDATEESQDEESATDEEGSDSIWDLIPSWQYDGHYVQSGGHSRGEQERALQDIQRQAEEIERSENEADSRQDN